MPLLETRASGSALAYGLNSGEELATISITGVYGNLSYAYNGTGLTIPRGVWGQYINLPLALQGAVASTSVNDGNTNLKFTTDKDVDVYMIRQQEWNQVDTTGWSTYVPYTANNYYITGYNNNHGIFKRTFTPGTHTLNNNSAMYLWTKSKIAPEQPSCTAVMSHQYDMNNPRTNRTFYSGNTWTDISGNGVNATFNSIVTSSDRKGIVFDGALSARTGSIVDSANPATSLSVDFWIKPTGNNAGWVRLFGKDPYSGGWLVFFETGGASTEYRKLRMLGVTNNGEQRNNWNGQLAVNQWQHVVCTWEVGNATSGMKLYVNGTLVSSAGLTGSSFVTSSNPIAICGSQSGDHFEGEIGSLRIYKGLVLNQREVAESYANGLMNKYGSYGSSRSAVVSPSVNGNTVWNFDTNGALEFSTQQEDSQFIIPLSTFNVSSKLWGAGGGARRAVTANLGGGGGYTSSTFPMTKNNCYSVTVGAFGKRVPDNTSPGSAYPVGPGGGGQAPAVGYSGQGGGYSAIFTKSKKFENVLLIAGGGGSGGVDGNTNGGAGGGSVAETGWNYGNVQTGNVGTGATSSAPGVNGYNNPSGSSAPGPLQGGSAGSGGDSGGGGGGGGGYYGGGAGFNGDSPPGNTGGGGGSGYIFPAFTGTTLTGSGVTPANPTDSIRGTAGNGAHLGNQAIDAVDGKVYIS